MTKNWTEGQSVLYFRDHNDETPRETTISRVLQTQVVIATGERFTLNGYQVGYGGRWFKPYIEPATAERLESLRQARQERADRVQANARRARIGSLIRDLSNDELQPIVDYLRQKGFEIA